LATFIVLVTACAAGPSIVPFTDGILNDVGGDARVAYFQYHISHGILLTREARAGDADLDGDGVAVIERRRVRNYVIIDADIPGLVSPTYPTPIPNPNTGGIGFWVEEGQNGWRLRASVAFEEVDGGRPTLPFGTLWNPSDTSRFYLLFYDWANRTVSYNGSNYTVTFLAGHQIPNDLSARPFLNIRLTAREIQEIERRRAGGLRIGQ